MSTKMNPKSTTKTKCSALEYYRAANHLFYHTYNLSKDPKIFVAILLNLHAAAKDLKKNTNKLTLSTRTLWKELEQLKKWQNLSRIEFKRGQQWVMCSERYKMKVLTANKIEKLLDSVKSII